MFHIANTEAPSRSASITSASGRRRNPSLGWTSFHVRMHSRNGATTRIPIASPVHHTVHALQKPPAGMPDDITKAALPIVALIVMLSSAPRPTSATTSRTRSICCRKPTRSSSQAATIGASVFPAAVRTAAGRFVIGRLTRSAAIATPGHRRRPYRRNATSARPVGGHSGVMLRSTIASRRPSLAAA